MSDLSSARSLLFVPGHQPTRFPKAVASGTDVVILDLEDAVPPSEKGGALEHVLAWVRERGPDGLVVRVNGVGTAWHDDEVSALSSTTVPVMLPKAEASESVATVAGRLAAPQILALIETARGLRNVDDVCAAPGVVRAVLGSIDLGADLGVDPHAHAAMRYARSRLVLASAAAWLPAPVDGPTTVLNDSALLQADLAEAALLGFTGRLCIHPAQVEATGVAFTPTSAQIAWARSVTSTAGDGAVAVDGAMVDPPVVRRAEELLRRAALHDGSSDSASGPAIESHSRPPTRKDPRWVSSARPTA